MSKEIRDSGFTLIELLIVMAVVGALLAIAIPQYSSYRKRAFDTRAQVDLRNVALAEEAYFLDSESYFPCADNGCTQLPGIKSLSNGVTLAVTTTASGFIGTAKHPNGTGRIYTWDTDRGGLISP